MKISAVAAIVVALGSVAMIMDGVKGGPWDAEQVLLSGQVVFLGLVGLCICMAPHRRKQFNGWGIPSLLHGVHSDKGKFHCDLYAARNVNKSEYALNPSSLRMTLNHRVPGSSPGAPTKLFNSLAGFTV